MSRLPKEKKYYTIQNQTSVKESSLEQSCFKNPRAATNILTKIRNFMDLRSCQKGPKSDQKGT